MHERGRLHQAKRYIRGIKPGKLLTDPNLASESAYKPDPVFDGGFHAHHHRGIDSLYSLLDKSSLTLLRSFLYLYTWAPYMPEKIRKAAMEGQEGFAGQAEQICQCRGEKQIKRDITIKWSGARSKTQRTRLGPVSNHDLAL